MDSATLMQQLSGPASTVFALLLVGHFIRKDINRCNDLDREDRKQERDANQTERENTQQLHKDTIEKIVTTNQKVVEKVVMKAEETERLSERRFELLLSKTFFEKEDPV